MKTVNTQTIGDPPVTLETLSKTLREHTTGQYETNNEFRASIRALETKSMSKIEELERKSHERFEELQATMDSHFVKQCELIAKKDSKSVEITEPNPQPFRHPTHQMIDDVHYWRLTFRGTRNHLQRNSRSFLCSMVMIW
ncbi:hypothetical protein Bca101_079890 [Brassica carinata]